MLDESSECADAGSMGETLSRSEERPTVDGPAPADPGALPLADRAPERAFGFAVALAFSEF